MWHNHHHNENQYMSLLDPVSCVAILTGPGSVLEGFPRTAQKRPESFLQIVVGDKSDVLLSKDDSLAMF